MSFKIDISIAMLLAVLLTGCTDEFLTAEELQGTQLADSREVKIAVAETSWDGATVSVTRAGETLEALKENSDRTWDFTNTPRTDVNLLKSDAAKAEGATWTNVDSNSDGKGDDTQFKSKSAFSTLQANGVALYMTEDLTFSGVSATEGDLRIDIDERLMINKQGIGITLPSLKKDQQITVKFSSTGSSARNIKPGGSVSSTAAVTSSSTTPVECTVTMTADGSPTFTVGEGTGDSSVYIYSISVTRAESDGFGLYSDSERLQVINSHIVWDSDIQSWKGISNDAYLMLWPNNIVKCDVAFNGTDKQSKPGYYTITTITENHKFNTKFNGCTYGGITFNKGLKMEDGTTISFNVGAFASSDNSATVTIVQSDWQDNGNPHGTPKTIMFDINGDGDYGDDGEVLDVASAVSIPGGKVYTIKKVAYGNHTITRGSGESGIFYVCVDIPFTAYSPYISDDNLVPAEKVDNYPTDNNDAYGFVSRNKDSIVFKPHSDNRIDLMYAEHTTSPEGVVQLNFKHALGKLSIGTIRNDYGENLRLTQIRILGTRYTKGTLSLSTGEWSSQTSSSATVTYGEYLLRAIFGNLDIPDKGALTFPKDLAYTQIPGTTLTFEYQFTTGSGTTFTVSAEMTFDQGVNKFVNITIGQNHEVVLE